MMSGDPLHKAFPKERKYSCPDPNSPFPQLLSNFTNTRSWRKALVLLQSRDANVARAVAEEQSWPSCRKSNLSSSVHTHRKLRNTSTERGTVVGLLGESSGCQGHGVCPWTEETLAKANWHMTEIWCRNRALSCSCQHGMWQRGSQREMQKQRLQHNSELWPRLANAVQTGHACMGESQILVEFIW